MNDGLPGDRLIVDDPQCPWCNDWLDDATVRLADLVNAHVGGELRCAPREGAGQAAPGALVCDCPNCKHPFVVMLLSRGERAVVRLRAVRTAADAVIVGASRR